MSMREEVLFEVFLDLWRDYATLDKERAIELITVYGVGPRTDDFFGCTGTNLP